MNKRIIIVNGSPRANGTVAHLLAHMEATFHNRGAETKTYTVSQMHIAPCCGCMKCRSTGVCVLPSDSAHQFAADLASADGIIVGTPVYWGNMNGQLKVLFDRIVPSLMGESPSGMPLPLHKHKRAVIAAACTTIPLFDFFAGESRGAVRAVKEILKYSGFCIARPLLYAGTKISSKASPHIVKCHQKKMLRLEHRADRTVRYLLA